MNYLLIILICIPTYLIYCLIRLIYSSDISIDSLNSLALINTVFFIFSFFYCFRNNGLKKHFSYILFLLNFFLFIISVSICNIIEPSNWGILVFSVITPISYLNEARGQIYILFSQIVLFYSYFLFFKKRRGLSQNDSLFEDENQAQYAGDLSLSIMYFSSVFAFLKLFFNILFVYQNGYLDTYLVGTEVSYRNPVIDFFDKFFELGYYGFLASFPPLKKAVKHSIVFIVFIVLSIFTGSRGTLSLGGLFLVWYVVKYSYVSSDNKIDSFAKKLLYSISFFGMFLIPLMNIYGQLRVGSDISRRSFLDHFLSFFSDRTISGKLVSVSLEYKDEILSLLPTHQILIWPIRQFLYNNVISRILGFGRIGHSYEILLSNPTFDAVITFATNPDAYFDGAGLGTCYIAELASSYGILSIFLGNILVGYFLSLMDYFSSRQWLTNILCLYSFSFLIYLPRQPFLNIIPNSFSFIVFIVFVYLCLPYKNLSV